MLYVNAKHIYDEEVRKKGLYVPQLSFEDEFQLEYLCSMINSLVMVLSEPTKLGDWFFVLPILIHFEAKRDYKRNVKELKDFLHFWSLPVTAKNKRIERFYGQS